MAREIFCAILMKTVAWDRMKRLRNTDEGRAYGRAPELGRDHVTVNHGAGEWARVDDIDGIREVHVNTMEGTWTGPRNFLRPFRGVSKWHLAGSVAILEWANTLKRVTDDFLGLLLSFPRSTDLKKS